MEGTRARTRAALFPIALLLGSRALPRAPSPFERGWSGCVCVCVVVVGGVSPLDSEKNSQESVFLRQVVCFSWRGLRRRRFGTGSSSDARARPRRRLRGRHAPGNPRAYIFPAKSSHAGVSEVWFSLSRALAPFEWKQARFVSSLFLWGYGHPHETP